MRLPKVTQRKATRLGLDIGTRLIKISEVSFEGNMRKLEKFDVAEIDQPATQKELALSLKSLLDRFKPSVKYVNISLAAPSTIVRFVKMPKMKKEELKKCLRFEAEKYIPFNIDEVIVDSVILDETPDEKNQIKVLIAAGKKDAVNSRIALLEELGLLPVVIDIDSFACFNAFCDVSEGLSESKSTALLNVGFTQTNVLIAQGDKPFFTRDIQIGAKDIARAIAGILGGDATGSEKFIYEHGEKAAEALEASKTVLDSLIEEIRLSFGYCENQSGKTVEEIYLSGGTGRMQGVLEYLREKLGERVAFWDPFAKFELGLHVDKKLLEAARPQFAVCAGLVLRK